MTALDLGPIQARLDALLEHGPAGPRWVHADGDAVYQVAEDGTARLLLALPLALLGAAGVTAVGEFAAHARTDVPALLVEVRELRARLTAGGSVGLQ